MVVKHYVKIDFSQRGVRHTIPISKGNENTHKIIFSFCNGSQTVDISSANIAAVSVKNGYNGSGEVGCVEILSTEGIVEYTPKNNALAVCGNIHCVLTLADPNGHVLYAPSFYLYVDNDNSQNIENEINAALHASDAWGLIADVTAAASLACTAAESVAESIAEAQQSADDAQAWAVGTINGELQTAPDKSNEEYATTPHIHNNAKHYAEQAGESADTAEMWAVGKKDGTPVASHAQNNAKYYADIATISKEAIATSENNAKKYAELAEASATGTYTDENGNKHSYLDIDPTSSWDVLNALASADRAGAGANIAEAWAVGTKDNAPITAPDDETYETTPHEENNAKYYATQAGESAADAKEIYDKLTKIMTFRGPVDDIPESIEKDKDDINIYKDGEGVLYQDGDVIAVTSGKYAEIEFVLWKGEWVELGDTSAAHEAIGELQSSVGALQEYAESNHIEKNYEVIRDGWYRIAQTASSVGTYNNLVQLYAKAKEGGYTNVSLFATSGSFTSLRYGNIPEITPIISSHYHARPVTEIRIRYPSVYNNNEAYLEIYVTKPAEIKISTIVNMGWSFYDEISDYTAVPTNYAAVVQSLNDIEENVAEAISEDELNGILK